MSQKPLTAGIIAELTQPVGQVMARYPTNRSAIMPALELAQKRYGTVDEDTYCAIAQLLDVPEIWVFEVASFYTMFNRSEVGDNHIQVCTNVSCMLRGADEILSCFKNMLSIEQGETTDDALFTLSVVECIGACDVAPALMVNEAYHGDLTCEKAEMLLSSLRAASVKGGS